jgi:DNA-directed RNA polymerase specialized sigma24 family protein
MPSGGSVTYWIGQLKVGDDAAAERLWANYFPRLVGLARAKLGDTPRGARDEEDVALSAFDSFCRGAERGRFPRLDDRDNLWALLFTITVRKACRLVRDERRQKRGGGSARPGPTGPQDPEPAWDDVLSREPTPELAAEMAEECQRLFECLGTDELRAVARWKMEGDTTEEIAAKLGRAASTVERKLRVIRSLWGQEEQA